MVKIRENVDWSEEILEKIANLAMNVPRQAFKLADSLKAEIEYSSHEEKTLEEYLDMVREEHNLDEHGLGPDHREYLMILYKASGPLGENKLLNQMETTDKRKIIEEIEPQLKQMSLVEMTSSGRELTRNGVNYVLENVKENE
jgi:Holliday junction resolvasome RuvABC ATP-dependent DNA helicase subunit